MPLMSDIKNEITICYSCQIWKGRLVEGLCCECRKLPLEVISPLEAEYRSGKRKGRIDFDEYTQSLPTKQGDL